MKKLFKGITAVILAVGLCGCSLQDKIDKEIQVPIYEKVTKVNTVTAEYMDLEESAKTAASIGYATADSLSSPKKGNLIAFNASTYESYKEGDVLAAFDSSELDYDYRRQSIYTEAAREVYEQQGTETARLEYEYQKALLEEIEYQKDQYVVYAPYDCVVTDKASLTIGAELEEGTYICSVAPAWDIFAYIGYDPARQSTSIFKLGSKVTVTLTAGSYDATVVSMPDSKSYNHPLRFMSDTFYADNFTDGTEPLTYDNSDYDEDYDENNDENNDEDPDGSDKEKHGYARQYLGLATGDYIVQDAMFNSKDGGPSSANSSVNIIIGFEPEVLEQLLQDTPNAVSAGWATVEIVTKKYSHVLALPESAVTVKDTSYVYLYENEQRIQTPVTVGDTVNGYTIILAGLCEGDQVAY